MDKTLSLIIAATVFIIAAMMLIFTTTDTLGSFSDVADSDSQVCNLLNNEYLESVEEGDDEAAEDAVEDAEDRDCSWVQEI